MSFTPKFADLVKSTTAVQGTGAVTLGAPVPGFRGFAEVCQAGDQFYYCIQGTDKPAETEVGRGTMLANGTIERSVPSGAPTKFTGGNKTIALVAAAEWFEAAAAGGAGTGNSVASVATRAQLAAVANPVDGMVRQLTEAGRQGTFVFRSGDYAARCTGDPAQGVFVAPGAQTGASGAWVRQFDGDLLFDWFGAVASDYTSTVKPDCIGAWNALSSYLTATRRNPAASFIGAGPVIRFPGAHYYFSDTIQLKHSVHLKGYASGQGSLATILSFAPGKAGIVVNRDNTLGDVQKPPTTGADGSVIEGLLLNGGGGTPSNVLATDLLKSGIRLRARATIRDVTVQSFVGAGICISAAVGDGSDPYHGNANNWFVGPAKLYGNGSCGLFVSGGDANAGTAIGIDASYNGRYGFYDGAFLGNSYMGCHADHNGFLSNGYAGSVVTQAGVRYYLRDGNSVATAQATTPGTNPAVWAAMGEGAAGGDSPAWSATGTYLPGGAYGHSGSANGCAYVGCYYETGQAPPQLTGAAIVVGGFMGTGTDDGAMHLQGSAGGMLANRPLNFAGSHANGGFVTFGANRGAVRLGLAAWGSNAATPSNPGQQSLIEQDTASGDLIWRSPPGVDSLRLTGPSTARSFGRGAGRDNRFITEVRELALGTGDNGGADSARVLRGGVAAPTVGAGAVGERVLNHANSAPDGWKCIEAGNPGKWMAFGTKPVIARSGDSTAAASDGNCYIRFSGAATFSLPGDAAVPFPVGTEIDVEQAGAESLTLAGTAGATVVSRGGDLTLAGQYAVATAKKIGPSLWLVTGDL